jgi:hypothetical protein
MKIINSIIVLHNNTIPGSTIKRTIEEECPDCYKDAPWHIKFMAHPLNYLRGRE